MDEFAIGVDMVARSEIRGLAMVDYVRHLSKAVHPSPRLLLSKSARAAVYRHAGDALQRQMKRYGRSVGEVEIAAELVKFFQAAAQVERAVQQSEHGAD